MIAFIVALAAVSTTADPIAPSKHGLVQCYAPNEAQKTCRSIGSYVVQPSGVVLNTATTMLSAKPLLVMQSTAPVVMKDGAVCGRLSRDDVKNATFTLNGAPIEGEAIERLKGVVQQGMAELDGHEVCTTSRLDGQTSVGAVTVDGVRRPAMEMAVKWVSPADYKVGP